VEENLALARVPPASAERLESLLRGAAEGAAA
jgi:hypothetical protein